MWNAAIFFFLVGRGRERIGETFEKGVKVALFHLIT